MINFFCFLDFFPGFRLKACYSSEPSSSSNRYQSVNAIGSVGGDKLAADTRLFQIINGTNGSRPNLYSTEIRVLDAFDDEYGGVIVDQERLPENPNAFACILHSSLSRWKMEVFTNFSHRRPLIS